MNNFSRTNRLIFTLLFFLGVILTQNTFLWGIPIQGELPKLDEMALTSEEDIPQHIWVAGQYLKAGEFKNVISICEQVLDMEEDNVETHALLAAAYKGLGEEDQFGKEVSILQKLDPKSPALYLSLAKTYLHLKDFQKAEDSYKEGLKVASDKTELHMDLGALYHEKGRLKEATEQYRKVLKKKGLAVKHFINANFALCRIGLQKKAYDEVIKRAKMMTDLYPPIEQSYRLFAQAYIEKSEPRKAIETYELLKKNNPHSPVPYQEIALIYIDKLNDSTNALKIAQEGVEKFPNDAKSRDVLGWVFYNTKRFEEAIKEFEEVQRLASDNPFYMYHLGLALQENDEKTKALSVFEKALEKVDEEKEKDFFMELKKRSEQCK